MNLWSFSWRCALSQYQIEYVMLREWVMFQSPGVQDRKEIPLVLRPKVEILKYVCF